MGGDEPDIKFSSSVDGHVKKETKQMDVTAAEAEALIPFYLERTVRESTKKQYRSYFILDTRTTVMKILSLAWTLP